MELKKLKNRNYETYNEKYDFHIRKEHDIWILDVFNCKISDSTNAYIESLDFESLKDTKMYAESYL